MPGFVIFRLICHSPKSLKNAKRNPPPGPPRGGGFLFAFFPSPAWVYPWPCLSSLPLNEECHNKAWDIVNNFMVNNVQMFCGTALNGISTIMPEVSFWVTSHLMMWQKLGTAVTTWWSSGPTCPLVASFQLLSWILWSHSSQTSWRSTNGMGWHWSSTQIELRKPMLPRPGFFLIVWFQFSH